MTEYKIDNEQYEKDLEQVVLHINSVEPQLRIGLTHRYAGILFEDYYEDIFNRLAKEITSYIATDILRESQNYRREQNEILRKL